MADTLARKNPASEEVLPALSCSTVDEVNAAYEAARSAQVVWARESFETRRDICEAFVCAVSEPRTLESLAGMITTEMGKPIKHARAEVQSVAARVRSFFPRVVEALKPEITEQPGL